MAVQHTRKPGNGVLRRFFDLVVEIETDDCMIWPFGTTAAGYGVITYDGRRTTPHRAACERRHGAPPSKEAVAAHGPCHNPSCFNPRHVSWGSHRSNAADRKRDGTENSGERNHFARLTAAQAEEIRQMHHLTDMTHQAIADVFGCCRSNVTNILNRKTWT